MSESIVKNKQRVGNFTSSQAWKLIPLGSRPMTEEELKDYKEREPKGRKKNIDAGFNAGGMTYIKSRKQERKRGRSMSMDASSQATAWGDLMEYRVYDIIDLDWTIESKSTAKHSKIPFWTGSWDLIVPDIKVGEIKGYYPEKFCDFADVLLQKDVALFREKFPEEYWQIVSSAAIAGVPIGESLLYQPYDSEAKEIMELCDNHPDVKNVWRYKTFYDTIANDDLYRLPFQPDDSGYPNLVTFEFEIPKEDTEYLQNRIIEAENELRQMDLTDEERAKFKPWKLKETVTI